MTPIYALSPSGPELSRRTLRRRLREQGVGVVTLPAGHYILADQRVVVEAVVAEINANLCHLFTDRPPAEEQLRVLYRPIPAPADGEVV